MPMYEYACPDCGKHTEIIQKFSDIPLAHCPFCGGHMERLISATAFVLKGGGWYKDGYASKSSPAANNGSTTSDVSPTCEKTGKPADSTCACANAQKSSA